MSVDGYILATIIIILISIMTAILLSRRGRGKSSAVTPLNILIAGTFLSIVLIYLPYYDSLSKGSGLLRVYKVLLSLYSSLASFFFSGALDKIIEFGMLYDGPYGSLYMILIVILHVISPVLTLGVLLLFFSNIVAYWKYLLGFYNVTYIFSELNERSQVLSRNLPNRSNKVFFVGGGVLNQPTLESRHEAEEDGAVVFDRSIFSQALSMHSKKSPLIFFMLDTDYGENLRKTKYIIEKYRNRAMTKLLFFSDLFDSEIALNNMNKGNIIVRRISEPNATVYKILYEQSIFEEPLKRAPITNGIRPIIAVIVGQDSYSFEMLKALVWCGQMDGFELTIHIICEDATFESQFCHQCPELMCEQHNGIHIEGEEYHNIIFHSGIATDTVLFEKEIMRIPEATLFFVSSGDDSNNIRTSVTIRSLFEKIKRRPKIMTIVRDSDRAASLTNGGNCKKQLYNIDYVGDIESIYREDVIIDSFLEEKALRIHKTWGDEKDFFSYEYNYRSSIASAIHTKYRRLLNIANSIKGEENLTGNERLTIAILMHKRWNAYMRSEGFISSKKTGENSSNYLAKVHHLLVPFGDLSERDKRMYIEHVFTDL